MEGLNINDITEEDQTELRYFINLVELNASENRLSLGKLVNLKNLSKLDLQANLLQNIDLEPEKTFPRLEILNLSYNYILPSQIENLKYLPNLRELYLNGNELQELPENLNFFVSLEILALNSNEFNSEFSANNFWSSLATIPLLKKLDISRNKLRGIHTEKLVAGNFSYLEELDFSHNLVDNQYNLICARTFSNLERLIVTGNPFAEQLEFKGLEMEVYARTGAKIINDRTDKIYLRKGSVQKKVPIHFEQLYKLNENLLKTDKKTYFFGVELPQKEIPIEQKDEKEEVQTDEDENNEEKFFLTENPKAKTEKIEKSEIHSNKTKSKKEVTVWRNPFSDQGSITKEKVNLLPTNIPFDFFKKEADDLIGQNKEYEQVIDLNSAYKILNQIVKKPTFIDFKEFEEPNYLRPTASIKRYKVKTILQYLV